MQELKVIILNLKNANYFLYKNIILVIYMINITYVTGNYGKYIAVKEHFEEKEIGIEFLEHDFDLTGIGYKPCEKPSQKYIYDAETGELVEE